MDEGGNAMFASLFANAKAPSQRNYSRLVIISDFHYPCKNLVTPKERLLRMAAKERVLQEMNNWRDLDLAVELSHQQLAWLDQTLAAHRQQPTIIFCHAPLEQTAVSSRPGISLPSPRNSVQPAGDIRTILARHHQVRLWVSGHTHTMPADATFMDDANYYEGRVLNVYNSDWDEDTIYTNSLYLYEDHILIRTYDHTRGTWLPAFDRTVTLPEWCCLTA